MTTPASGLPELRTAALPAGWEMVTGPGIAIAAELGAGDPRLPHLQAAVGSGRFADALTVLGRLGGPPSCAAAVVGEGSGEGPTATRVVVAKQAHAVLTVAGQVREVRPVPPGDWAQVVVHDVESVLLVPGLGYAVRRTFRRCDRRPHVRWAGRTRCIGAARLSRARRISAGFASDGQAGRKPPGDGGRGR